VTPTVGVVVLAWKDEPSLAECVAAVRASEGVDVRLVVVDNGSPDIPPDVEALEPGRNTGFAGGCNLGAAALDTEYLALVNSDCVIAPDTLRLLVAEASRPGVGPVMASIRLPDGRLNSGGNPVHLIGLSWAGGLNTTETRTEPYDVTGASGACLLLAATVWKQLGGFDEEYFAYLEDSERGGSGWPRGASPPPWPAITTSSPATPARCTCWSATG
jgi:GT2 family glycosyltransferase